MSVARLASLCFLGAALALALAAFGFLPRAGADDFARPALDVVLVDVSASEARARAWLPWARAALERAAQASAARGREIAVVAYAEAVAVPFSPGAPAQLSARLAGRGGGAPLDPRAGVADGATRLADALAAVTPWCTDGTRPAGTLTLLARPDFTGPSPAAELARLASAGVEVRAQPPPAPEEGDLALEELALAPSVETGAPLVARLRGRFRAGAETARAAELLVTVQGANGEERLTRALVLPVGGGVFELPLALGSAGEGRTRVEVRARFESGGDPWPENDRVEARTVAAGARVVVVAVADELEPQARAWLVPAGPSALAGLQFVFVRPAEVARELATAAALVSFDVAPGELPAAAVDAFVRGGGGWLALSGWRFQREWLPGEPPGESAALLPCVPGSHRPGPRDVVLLIDGSGSMEGAFETVRTAALELVRSALPEDRVSLRFFTTGLEPEALLKERRATRAEQEEAAAEAARTLLALRVPRGSTYLFSSLAQLARALDAPEALVLLLTDGRDRDPLALEGAAEAARAALVAAGAELVVVAVGDSDEETLARLAGAPERVQRGDALGDLTTLFHRALHGAQLVEGELALTLAPRASGSLAAEVASAGQGAVALLPLERFLRNELRPGAEALWQGPGGEPVLALARAGLGRTALFASRPGGDWARRYVRAGLGEPAEFEGLLRWLARGERGPSERRARLDGGELEVSGLAPETPAELRARLEPAGIPVVLTPPSALGRDPLRTRRAPLAAQPAEGAWLVLEGAGGAELLALTLGPRDEFAGRARTVPEDWLEGPGSERAPAGSGPRGWARPLVWLAVLLLLAGALLRIRGQGVEGFDR